MIFKLNISTVISRVEWWRVWIWASKSLQYLKLKTQTQTQNILFNSNNHICKYKVKTETPLGLFAFYSWKIFINVMQDLWEWHSGVSKSALKNVSGS